jgi:hypothetical protein
MFIEIVVCDGTVPARWEYIVVIVIVIMFITIIIPHLNAVQFLGAFVKFRKSDY